VLVAATIAAAAVLLVVAGAAKLRTPGPAATMLVGFWPGLRPLRRARAVARAAGVVELGAGLAVLAVGGRVTAAVLTACYLALTIVAVRLALRSESAPCGCFGAADGDVGPAHIVLDVAALGVGVAALVHPVGSVAGLFTDGTLTGFTLAGQAALLAALGYLSITALPALTAARRTTLERS
jgi:hypothetical protein